MKVDEIKKLLEQKKEGKSKEKAEWIKPPSEANKKFTFRILPYTEEGDFTVIKWYHWGVGEKFRTECTRDEHCPICKVLNKYRADNWKKISRYLSKGQAYFNVQLPSESNQVYLFAMSDSFLGWLLTTSQELQADFLNPETGRDIIIWRKTDKGAFEKMLALNTRPIAETEEKRKEILSKTVNLETYFKPMTDEDLIKIQLVAEDLDKKLKSTIIQSDDLEIEEINLVEEKDKEIALGEKPKPKECFGEFRGVNDNECVLCEYATDCMSNS